MILRDIRKGRTIISGNTVIICEELEEIIRKVHESFINSLGEEGADVMIHEIFNNALLSEEERDRKAEKEHKNADEKVLAEFDTFFKKIMKEGN